MSIGWKKVAVIGAVAAIALALAMFRPGSDVETTDASFTTPGSWAAVPSGLPGMPTVTNQLLPAIAPADGDGSVVAYGAFCDPVLAPCPNDPAFNVPSIVFVLKQRFPTDNGSTAASFTASGGQRLVCADGALCDRSPVGDSSIIVEITGGNANEVVKVVQCENTGSSQVDTDGCALGGDKRDTGRIIFVKSIFAVSPSQSSAAVEGAIVSYRCDQVGPAPTWLGDPTGAVGPITLEDLWNFSGPGGLNLDFLNLGGGFDALYFESGGLLACGGNTSSPLDNRVNFETDKGIFTVDEVGDVSQAFTAAVGSFRAVSTGCDAGESVSVLDNPSFTSTAGSQRCDIDGAPNGVISYILLGTGDVGVASVTAQQSGIGGATVPRNINVTFTGAPALSLFITAPAQVGLTGDDFTVTIVDQDGRPNSGLAVECTVDPPDGALVILPQTGSTGADGTATFTLVPTGISVLGGEVLTITCVLDVNRDVRDTATVNLSPTPDRTTVELATGCNLVAFMPFYAAGTDLNVVTDDISGGDPRLWFQTGPTSFALFDPSSPERSEATVLEDEAGFVCVDEDATWNRPS